MKIGLVSPTNESPSSFYRAFGVWPYLARENNFELMVQERWDWTHLAYLDAVYMHCPATNDHRALAELCRHMKVPLWVDHDDQMFDVPIGNQAQQFVMRPSTQTNIRRILDLAQLVTVSTPALVDMMCPEAVVVPNALNDYVWSFAETPRRKAITWRGGPAHMADLQVFGPAIAKTIARHPDWRVHFLGLVTWDTPEIMPPKSFLLHPWDDLLRYHELLTLIQPAIHIVPMRRTPFNLAKSNCCWLEATAAGACVVAPDWPGWQQPGVIRYQGLNDFSEALEAAIVENHASLATLSRQRICDGLLLSQVNKQRLSLLESLVSEWGTGKTQRVANERKI